MVEEYLSDREQEEALRSWWRENWRWIVGGVVLGVGLLYAWTHYQSYREKQAHSAAAQYAQVQSALSGENVEKATAALDGLSKDFDKSAYTHEARLLVAKWNVDHGKFDEAAGLLRTVADNAPDEEMAQIARLRLARVLLQQGKHDAALQLLDTTTAGEFAGREREIRGDAQVAKGDLEAARAEYAAALAGGDAQIDRPLLELKLQEVGGTAPAAKPAQPTLPVAK